MKWPEISPLFLVFCCTWFCFLLYLVLFSVVLGPQDRSTWVSKVKKKSDQPNVGFQNCVKIKSSNSTLSYMATNKHDNGERTVPRFCKLWQNWYQLAQLMKSCRGEMMSGVIQSLHFQPQLSFSVYCDSVLDNSSST